MKEWFDYILFYIYILFIIVFKNLKSIYTLGLYRIFSVIMMSFSIIFFLYLIRKNNELKYISYKSFYIKKNFLVIYLFLIVVYIFIILKSNYLYPILYFPFSAFYEELIFKVYFYNSFKIRGYNKFLIYIFISIGFVLFHYSLNGFFVNNLVILDIKRFLFQMVTLYIYDRTEDIYLQIGIHSLYNFIIYFQL